MHLPLFHRSVKNKLQKEKEKEFPNAESNNRNSLKQISYVQREREKNRTQKVFTCSLLSWFFCNQLPETKLARFFFFNSLLYQTEAIYDANDLKDIFDSIFPSLSCVSQISHSKVSSFKDTYIYIYLFCFPILRSVGLWQNIIYLLIRRGSSFDISSDLFWMRSAFVKFEACSPWVRQADKVGVTDAIRGRL